MKRKPFFIKFKSHSRKDKKTWFLTPLVFLALLLATNSQSIYGQKKITPVDNDPNKPAQPTLHYYDKHGNPLDEPVLFMSELDTVVSIKPKPVYPLLYSASLGFNFFDGVMKLFGQSFASYDIQASVSLHNWFEPVVELGLGSADHHTENSNYRYKTSPSFYGKIGINYNFMYKSNPDYQVYLGIRGGFSSYKYEIEDVTINSDYWGQSNKFSILNQSGNSFYGQTLAGIKVKIWKWFSLGWNIRYGFKIKESHSANSIPWFVPGYGTGALSASFSLIYTMPIHTKKKEEPIETIGTGPAHISGGIPEP
ncbi:MAG: hypothetical protein J1F12_07720 [Muribaculaceae bacterium]|nr:hypothetical protein [Muribaculaceae bacterium]